MKPTSAFRPRFLLPAFSPVRAAPRASSFARVLAQALSLAAACAALTGCGVEDRGDRRAEREDRREETPAPEAQVEVESHRDGEDAESAEKVDIWTSAKTRPEAGDRGASPQDRPLTLVWLGHLLPEYVEASRKAGYEFAILKHGFINVTKRPLTCEATLSYRYAQGGVTRLATHTTKVRLEARGSAASSHSEELASEIPARDIALDSFALSAVCDGVGVRVGAVSGAGEDLLVDGKPLEEALAP